MNLVLRPLCDIRTLERLSPSSEQINIPTFFQVPNFEVLSEKLMMYQAQYNDIIRGSSLDLVFFKDAMTHVVKVRLKAILTHADPVE